MSEWLQYRDEYLKVILEREAPPLCGGCTQCTRPMIWRCHDCFGEPVFCPSCVATTHQSLPFHRVSRWNGRTFYRSSLSDAGLVLNIGHGGRPCPTYATSPSFDNTCTDDSNEYISPDPDLPCVATPVNLSPLTSWEAAGINLDTVKAPQHLNADGNPWLTVIDTTGIHQIQVRYCRCTESSLIPEYLHLLKLGLYPASISQPRTVFTFRALDDYDVLNLETKASPQRYLAKLQRQTTSLFTDALPDRYRELLRLIRQWRNLKQHKNAGSAYSPPTLVTPGSLAQFCPACPQPGVNLPDNWQDDPNP